MNILPKKKWHVRTKENVARVRRDQKLAAKEEQLIRERAQLAEQQFKVNLLRKNADERMSLLYGTKRNETATDERNVHLEGPSGHVNLFAELEEVDRKNLGTGNKEYEEEKRKEREEYESKVGILKYLGEGSNEFTKQKSWYEQLPPKRVDDNTSKQSNEVTRVLPTGVMDLNEAKKLSKKESKRKKEKNKHKKKRKRTSGDWEEHSRKRKRHRSYNSSEGFKNKGIRHDSAERSDSSEQLQKLRRERMQREEMEKKKTFDLLHPLKEQAKSEDINPKYSSQFNPALARQNRFR
uniref:Leukocyte receptor cluster member 1 n=1 Tax=Ascaris suum TaxID=6253 RepID=F1LAA0_ASCSU